MTLPGLAAARRWPVRHDHCFQRILLDAACSGRWLDHIAGRPAYRHLDDARLSAAVAFGHDVATARADLDALNRRSLAWRGKRVPHEKAPAVAGRGSSYSLDAEA